MREHLRAAAGTKSLELRAGDCLEGAMERGEA